MYGFFYCLGMEGRFILFQKYFAICLASQLTLTSLTFSLGRHKYFRYLSTCIIMINKLLLAWIVFTKFLLVSL